MNENTYGSRLLIAMEAKNATRKDLASALGVSVQAVGDVLRGKSGAFTAENNAKAARYLGVNPNWLATGNGQMKSPIDETTTYLLTKGAKYGVQPVAVFDDGDVLSDDYIQIKEYEIKFSAGNGRTPVFDELTDSVVATFRRDWFHRMGINPARAIRVKVHGSSMYPLLHNGDSVVVNLAETNIINDKVYALRYGDELRIKRLYRKLDGSLILHSDNPDFIPRDEEVPPSVVESSISIVGRVRDKSGAGGL